MNVSQLWPVLSRVLEINRELKVPPTGDPEGMGGGDGEGRRSQG